MKNGMVTREDRWLRSQICSQKQLESNNFQEWAERLGEARNHLHRKVWEWCFIAQALDERGFLKPGMRGLGFAVGREPLVALFCSLGVSVCATDLFPDSARRRGWMDSNQHASSLEILNSRGICPTESFFDRCTLRYVDMRWIPHDLRGFDFVWSSCSMEHLSSLDRGTRFVREAMKCVRPGGIAVHTTEFNVSSNDTTVNEGDTVIYRRKDIEKLSAMLSGEGYAIDIDWSLGSLPADLHVDTPPFTHDPHLRLRLGEYIVTSIGMIISKA